MAPARTALSSPIGYLKKKIHLQEKQGRQETSHFEKARRICGLAKGETRLSAT